MKIAILLATFNRKEKTLTCLRNLQKQRLPEGAVIEVYLTDDASSDGTADAVREQFPDTTVIDGTGSLYWSGGMRSSWKAALSSDADYYLLVNDDTYLESDAILRSLQCINDYLRENDTYAISVGRTKDPVSGEVTYGGYRLYKRKKLKHYLVPNDDKVVECDLGCANIMMVPSQIAAKIGIISDAYTHGFGDYDYTLRAKEAGFKVLIPPGVLGTCVDDHGAKDYKSSDTRLPDRIKYLYSPTGLAYTDYVKFVRRHFPSITYSSIAKIWIKTLFPVVYDRYK